MPKTERRELRITPEMAAAIDQARGDVPFNRWAERAFEKALGDQTAALEQIAKLGRTDGPAAPLLVKAGDIAEAALAGKDPEWTPAYTRKPVPPPGFNRVTSLKR